MSSSNADVIDILCHKYKLIPNDFRPLALVELSHLIVGTMIDMHGGDYSNIIRDVHVDGFPVASCTALLQILIFSRAGPHGPSWEITA